MFRHLLNLIRQPECLLSLFVFPHTITENSQSGGNSRMILPEQSQAELTVKDHPTLPLFLASGFHLQIQVGFEGDPSLEAHKREDFGFLWLQWGTCGTTVESTTLVLPSHPGPSHKMCQFCVSLIYISIKVWQRNMKNEKFSGISRCASSFCLDWRSVSRQKNPCLHAVECPNLQCLNSFNQGLCVLEVWEVIVKVSKEETSS